MDDSLHQLARATRADLEAATVRGAVLLDRVYAIPPRDRDAWLDEVLGLGGAPPTTTDLPRGGVPYLPAGVEEILTMVREVPLTSADTLVDLGAGLGRVLILAHLLSGARGVGIEVQAPLVTAARARCAELGLSEISFVHANAEDVAFDGSVVFLYAPFNGAMLRRVLDRVEEVARRRELVVCTVDLELHDVPWLRPRATHHALSIYESIGTSRTSSSASAAPSP